MGMTEVLEMIAVHLKGKVISHISTGHCDKDPLMEDRLHPVTVRTNSININFTDKTSVMVESITEHFDRSSESRLRVSFWCGKELIHELGEIE